MKYNYQVRIDRFNILGSKVHIRYLKQMIQVNIMINIGKVNYRPELISLNLKSDDEYKKCGLKILVESSDR